MPRFSHGPQRGDERLSWLAFTLLNAGISLIVLQSLFGLLWLTFAGRGLEFLGLIAFAIGNWKRIKPHGA